MYTWYFLSFTTLWFIFDECVCFHLWIQSACVCLFSQAHWKDDLHHLHAGGCLCLSGPQPARDLPPGLEEGKAGGHQWVCTRQWVAGPGCRWTWRRRDDSWADFSISARLFADLRQQERCGVWSGRGRSLQSNGGFLCSDVFAGQIQDRWLLWVLDGKQSMLWHRKWNLITLFIFFLFPKVALNFQTAGLEMDLNDGLFKQNGGCGFVLKPDFMRDGNTQFSPEKPEERQGYKPLRLSIQVQNCFKSSWFVILLCLAATISVELFECDAGYCRILPCNIRKPVDNSERGVKLHCDRLCRCSTTVLCLKCKYFSGDQWAAATEGESERGLYCGSPGPSGDLRGATGSDQGRDQSH